MFILIQIVNWRTHLKFPEEAKLTIEAKEFISRLLCDVEHRLGTRGVAEIKVYHLMVLKSLALVYLNVLICVLNRHSSAAM